LKIKYVWITFMNAFTILHYGNVKGSNSDFALYYAGDSNFTEKFNFAKVLWQ